MTYSQYRVYVVLFILVLSSWFLADLFESKKTTKIKIKDHSPDYFSKGYFKKETGLDGVIKSELKADEMIHYADDQRTHLEKPVMTLYNPNIPPWVIKSERAILEADGDHLQLLGKVFVRRDGTENLRSFNLNTSELEVKLSTSYATTSQWAEIVDAQNITQGVGLQMTFKEPIKLNFLSEVKGLYVFN